MNENNMNEFETESLTVTISGLANAIATGSATELVFEDAADARAHMLVSESSARQVRS